jgi:probable rRNA maturation factor
MSAASESPSEDWSPPPVRQGRPELSLHDHGENGLTEASDLDVLRRLLDVAWPLILAAPGDDPTVLPDLPEVEISLLDDAAITAIHGEFLQDPTPTDVITFHHGEILVSVETAAREAAARQAPFLRETALYIIHGLLHLHGHTDAEPDARTFMHAAQDRILDAVWPPAWPTWNH